MAIRENLQAKQKLDTMAKKLDSQIRPVPGQSRLDKDVLRNLLEFAGFEQDKVRKNEIYTRPLEGEKKEIVVVDNEMPVYQTTIKDVGLRKSPHWQEAFSVKNVIKILNDKDVVVGRRKDSLKRIYERAFSRLDFSYTDEEIEKMVSDGRWGLEDEQPKLVEEILGYFLEILGYDRVYSELVPSGIRAYGRMVNGETAPSRFDQMLLYEPGRLRLVLMEGLVALDDEEDVRRLLEGLRGRKPVDARGGEVFAQLGRMAEAIDPEERPSVVRGFFSTRSRQMAMLH